MNSRRGIKGDGLAFVALDVGSRAVARIQTRFTDAGGYRGILLATLRNRR